MIEALGWLSASSGKKVILRRIEEREQEGFKSQSLCRILRSLNLDDVEVKKEKIAVVPSLSFSHCMKFILRIGLHFHSRGLFATASPPERLSAASSAETLVICELWILQIFLDELTHLLHPYHLAHLLPSPSFSLCLCFFRVTFFSIVFTLCFSSEPNSFT